jgi:hypothetical protein
MDDEQNDGWIGNDELTGERTMGQADFLKGEMIDRFWGRNSDATPDIPGCGSAARLVLGIEELEQRVAPVWVGTVSPPGTAVPPRTMSGCMP